MASIQVTLGASATQISPRGIGYRQMIVQNNSANSVRTGDSTVTGTKGTLIVAGANANYGPANIQLGVLSDRYIFGTVGSVIDIEYLPA